MLRRLDIQMRSRQSLRNSIRRKAKARPFKLSMRRKGKVQRQKKKRVRSRPMSNFTLYSSYTDEPPTLAPTSTSMPDDKLPNSLAPTSTSMPNDKLPKWQKSDALSAPTTNDTLPKPKWQTSEVPSQPTPAKFLEKVKITSNADWQDTLAQPTSAPNKPDLLQSTMLPDACKWLERPAHQSLFGSSPRTPRTPRIPSPRPAWNGGRQESSSSLE